MASLQIRDLPDLPDPLHRLLQRRQLALERIAKRWQQRPALQWGESPEFLIRSDRER